VAGRIREEDIAEVREKARIDDVISAYVTLKSAGGGNLKGLCPFHDEKSPSFNVTPARGMYHCFGCGQGGDVIKFVMEIDGLGFTETVERLADKVGVQLRYEEGGPQRASGGPQRPRLVEAHKHAAAWYAELLASSPDASTARQFLSERGFDQEAAATFGVGFSPRGGDDLVKHLRQQGFRDDELVASGLAGDNNRGLYDRFRGRLMWPIRDSSGDVIGFGARRLIDDDRIEAKYLNTPETPISKKSHVLDGIDPNDVQREVRRASGRAGATAPQPTFAPPRPAAELPDARDPRFTLERETLKLVIQHPAVIAPLVGEVDEHDFTHPAYRAVWAVVTSAGGVGSADAQWSARLQAATADERLRGLLTALAVETVRTSKDPTPAYAAQHVHRLRELTALRRIADLKSRLQRTNPVDEATEYNRMFGELVALEQHRRDLRERALATE
jgi:hypothetical protein